VLKPEEVHMKVIIFAVRNQLLSFTKTNLHCRGNQISVLSQRWFPGRIVKSENVRIGEKI